MSIPKHIADTVTLNNGVRMPWLGLGVWQAKDGEQVVNAIRSAVEIGYRSIDTASFYHNEEGVGRAIRECGVNRDELFVTTKVWNDDQGYESTLKAFESSRRKLGLDVIDLYLVHWPVKGKFVDTYRALEKLYREGSVRAIGVSNFLEPQLHELLAQCEVIPAVNQIEFHPLLTQPSLRSLCREKGIQLEAWSSLMQGNLDLPLLKELAAKYGKSPAQIILRWDLQRGVVTIPKTVTPSRLAENAALFDFELSEEDAAAIDALNKGRRFGPDPLTFV
ncbi:glyoxal reductase [Paenibacillus sp. CCS19]|uniref:aldo/keto reductase n=1 Tax=Paenibacillus sp. CCS19 TaxID=3158387 RepID=UPI00256A9249|nr:aldo/keto reductase [Paenibacillus cellulosilyticus]GMK38168.1 glyoxal reductase [Paenibacillus cellulosilyticus]